MLLYDNAPFLRHGSIIDVGVVVTPLTNVSNNVLFDFFLSFYLFAAVSVPEARGNESMPHCGHARTTKSLRLIVLDFLSQMGRSAGV